jgi:putative hydrolase of the HAD superfamily
MIKAVILGADGVLINGERFAVVLSRELDVDPAKEKEFFTTTFQDCLVGKADLKESVAPYLSSFGWSGDVETFLEFWFKSEHSLNEELMGYVDELRNLGIKVILATNQEKYRTGYMLKHMGFDGKFDAIYSSAHLGLKKPSHEFYKKILSDMQLMPEETIFWDDEEKNIQGAKEVGIHAEMFKDNAHFMKITRSLVPVFQPIN